jgi:hypothetical protein
LLPGSNLAGLGVAASVGMRVALPLMLMASNLPRPWDRYMPRNPGLM